MSFYIHHGVKVILRVSCSNQVALYSNVLKTKSDMARGKRIGLDQNGNPICFLEAVLELPPFLV